MLNNVLVVDDHEANRYYLKVLLESQGCKVGLACNGVEALEIAEGEDFDLVVSDLLMPKMDGFTLLSRWIDDAKLHLIPFVVYTGTYTEPEDRDLTIKLGAQAFLVKPMEPLELLAELQRVAQEFNQASLPSPTSEKEKSLVAEKHSEILVRKLTNRNRELEHNQQRLLEEIREKQALLDALEARVAQLDSRGVITKVNRAWKEFAQENGMTTADWGVGLNYLDVARSDTLTGEAEMQTLVEGIRGVLDGEHNSFFCDYPCHTSSKQSWFRLMVTSLNDAPGRGALVLHFDVTQQKVTESQLLRAQRLESIGTLAGGIAHDLNNTLAPILMAIELLKSQRPDAFSSDLLESIETSTLRAGDLVRQVLLFARGAQGKRVEVDLKSLVQEVLKIAQDTFPKNIQISWSSQLDDASLIGDRTQLHQVLLNLCLNARDAMPSGGRLVVLMREAEADESRRYLSEKAWASRVACIDVTDTGTGIAPEHLDYVFDPFFTTKSMGKGTGLGLSTSLAIVKSHGGALDVSSVLGEGTSFRVFLPLEEKVRTKVAKPESRGLLKGEGETILVVDDEAAIRSLTQRLLQMSGYKVLLASSGAEAVALLAERQESVDLVITDIMMPGMDGSALIQSLRENRPGVKIIACSGLDFSGLNLPEEIKDSLAFLAKPFNAQDLLAAVKKAIRPDPNVLLTNG